MIVGAKSDSCTVADGLGDTRAEAMMSERRRGSFINNNSALLSPLYICNAPAPLMQLLCQCTCHVDVPVIDSLSAL
jgi:hypothetical protein